MRRWQVALRLIGVGWYVAISILLGVVGGLELDKAFDTAPFFALAGLLLGIVVAGYGVYQMFLPLIGNKEDKEDG